jgi:H+/Cl- antiporter ClcA
LRSKPQTGHAIRNGKRPLLFGQPNLFGEPLRNFAARFWLAIVLTGVGTGASAAALMLILQAVQHTLWPGADMTLLDAASQATPWRHVLVLLGAGLATGAGQILLVRLTASNSIDITEAIWFSAGRLPALADRHRPKGWWRLVAPVMALGLLGLVSIAFPQLLGNGKDIAQLAFTDQLPLALLAALLILKPAATVLCLGSGVPGGLFTPSLALGALLGAILGHLCAFVLSGAQPALVAVMGAGAVLAATTQGPISAVVLMMELTGQDRSFIAPLMLAVVIATLLSRTIEPRSIYDARLTDEEIAERQKMREPARP